MDPMPIPQPSECQTHRDRTPQIAIFMISVNHMLIEDIRNFMFLFLMFLAMFYFAMFILYPAPNPMAPQFNDAKTAFSALIDLAFLGEGIELDMFDEETGLDFWQSVDFKMFVLMYYFYILMAMILLLNLLIALMGSTFTKVTEESTLRYRQDFARRVLRLELLARRMNFDTNVGRQDRRAEGWERRDGRALLGTAGS